MRLIVPHLRRAVLISNMVDHGKEQAALFGDTLDGIAAGLFLVDANGRILHANASGHALLAQGVVLRAYGGKLVSNDASAKLYKLTPMELRVLFAIVQVGGVPEVAAMMGSSGSTIRTHLRRLFSKTGTDRQADLVKLVAGYSNPLLPPARVFEHPHTIGGRGTPAPKLESSALDGRSGDVAWL